MAFLSHGTSLCCKQDPETEENAFSFLSFLIHQDNEGREDGRVCRYQGAG